MGRKSTVDLDEQKVITDYQNGLSMVKIADQYQCKTHHIDWILRKHDIKKRSNKENSRRFHCNHRFFETIDSEEKAYWLGFFAADGYVTKRGYVGVTLSSVDKAHLEKLNVALESTYPVNAYRVNGYRKDTMSARLLLSSKEMKDDLLLHGITENKTLTLQFPDLPEDMIRHFVRGYFDGDGSWSYHKSTNQYQFKVVGTKEILTGILESIGFQNHKLYKRRPEHTNTFYISIGGNKQVLSIMEYLYTDATVYLERKYEKYKQLNTQSH